MNALKIPLFCPLHATRLAYAYEQFWLIVEQIKLTRETLFVQ